MSEVLVTGAAGFLGWWLCDGLLSEGHTVYGVDNFSDGDPANIESFQDNENFHFSKVDLGDPYDEVFKALKSMNMPRLDVIYHMAADATEGRSQFTPISCTRNNLVAYEQLLVSLLNLNKFDRMVCVTSMSVYGDQSTPFNEERPRTPVDVYGWNKAAMEGVTETFADVYDFDYVIIRPHNVYGRRQSRKNPYRNVLAIWINSLMRNKHFWVYGDGAQKRAFSHAQDAIPAFIKAGFDDRPIGHIINLGAAKPYTLNEAAQIVCEEFFAPDEIPDWAQPKHLEDRPREVKVAYTTIDKSVKLLDYQDNTSLREGIKEMVAWMKEKGPVEPEYIELELTTEKTPSAWRERLI